ncbi:TolC family protein [Novosphingobium sp. PASSN1]|uniref:TolC family protein n=1 Tax=Novosphingobium sp. PASSN1 TaxID=2015561 RepID=UPI0025DFE6C1|nr:TolC family protein [Novosphingobium sp. PASSN1]
MKIAAHSPLFAGMLVLVGCKVGRDYHLPASAAINRPSARAPLEIPATLAVADDLPPRWWHLYDDPVLDGLEEQALAGRSDLRVAAANLARAHAMTEVAKGAAEPEFAIDAAAERARLSGESFLLPEALPVASLGSADLRLSYQSDLFGRVRRSIEAARADEETRRELVGAGKVTLAGEVARAYVGICSAQEEADTLAAAVAGSGTGRRCNGGKCLRDAGRFGPTTGAGWPQTTSHRTCITGMNIPITQGHRERRGSSHEEASDPHDGGGGDHRRCCFDGKRRAAPRHQQPPTSGGWQALPRAGRRVAQF